MRRFAADNPVPNLNLLPFLDLVFAVIGILIVVFALQEAATRASGRQLAIDDLVICVAEGEVTLYAGPAAEPVRYAARQFPALFAALAERPEVGIRNLVFALTGACFETRRQFEEEFARFTALLHDRGGRRAVFRAGVSTAVRPARRGRAPAGRVAKSGGRSWTVRTRCRARFWISPPTCWR